MSSSPHFGTGQTHLNSDAKIADEGRPQGAPLPIDTNWALCPGEGTHKGRPYHIACKVEDRGAPCLGRRAPTRGAPTNCLLSAFCPGEPHKGRPYQLPSLGPGEGNKGRPYQLPSLGVFGPWGGHPQGAPLPIAFSRRYALGRAPTRGAPTNCLRPWGGVMPWGGHPQGAPLPIAFSRRYALGRAPTRGAPTDCLLSALCPGEGAHKGRPYRLSSLGVMGRAWGGHPQGAPLPIVLSLGVMAWGGHPQGAPLPIVFSRRYGLGRAPTRGAPTDCLLSALCPGEGTHKGRPYRLSSLGVMAWGGHPQGAPLPIVFSRRYALGRAPTRGAPTDCLLSALCPGEGTHKGRPYRLSSLGVLPWGGHPQGAPLPLLSALCPGEGTHKGRPYRLPSLGVMPWGGHPQGAPLPIAMPWGGHPQGAPLPIVFSRRYALGRAPQGAPLPIVFSRRFALGRAPTRGAPTDSGTHKGRPYYALGRAPTRGAPTDSLCPRAPTRGAPTRFRQPHVGLSQFDAIALHFGMHPAAMGRAGAQFGSPRSCCKGNRRRL